MSRIDNTLSALKAQNRKALIPFVTAGFPYPAITPELMHGMAEAGAVRLPCDHAACTACATQHFALDINAGKIPVQWYAPLPLILRPSLIALSSLVSRSVWCPWPASSARKRCR
jgi:hypothetical protein